MSENKFLKVDGSVQNFAIGEKILIIYKGNNQLTYRENVFDRMNKICVVGQVIKEKNRIQNKLNCSLN